MNTSLRKLSRDTSLKELHLGLNYIKRSSFNLAQGSTTPKRNRNLYQILDLLNLAQGSTTPKQKKRLIRHQILPNEHHLRFNTNTKENSLLGSNSFKGTPLEVQLHQTKKNIFLGFQITSNKPHLGVACTKLNENTHPLLVQILCLAWDSNT